MGNSASQLVSFIDNGETFVVHLHNPPTNALDAATVSALSGALDEFGRSDARALIIDSTLNGFFATSAHRIADSEHADGVPHSRDRELPLFRSLVARLVGSDLPTIAALEGLAEGRGLELAMACTLRIGSRAAHVEMPGHGLPVSGTDARGIGLLDELVDPGFAYSHSLRLARDLSSPLGPLLTQILSRVDETFDSLPVAGKTTGGESRDHPLFDGPGARTRFRALMRDRGI